MKLTRPIVYAIAGLAVVLVLIAVANSLLSGKRAKDEAKLNRNVAGAALESGRDAVGAVGKQQAAEAASDALTGENAAAIRNAPGADAKVDPGATSAGIKAICRRQSARNDPRCRGL